MAQELENIIFYETFILPTHGFRIITEFQEGPLDWMSCLSQKHRIRIVLCLEGTVNT